MDTLIDLLLLLGPLSAIFLVLTLIDALLEGLDRRIVAVRRRRLRPSQPAGRGRRHRLATTTGGASHTAVG